MQRKLSASVALSALFAALMLSCDQDERAFRPEDEDAFVSSVTGRVTDRQGRPLAGALVTASPSGISALSGEDGCFRLRGLVAGSYRIDVARHDYLDTMWLDSARLGLSAVQSVGTLAMRFRYAVVEGVVVDSGGNARSGAGVSVENQMSEAVSSGSGQFTLFRVEPGRVRLFAALAGAGYGMLDTVVGAEDTLRNARLRLLRRGGVIEGRVVGNDGEGLEGATVGALGGALEARTGPDGTFRLADVPGGGSVALEITKGNAASIVTGVRVADGSRTELPAVVATSPSRTDASVRSGVAMVFTTDSVVVLMAETVSDDSTFHAFRHLWSLDGGRTWDTTAANVREFLPKRLGWMGGMRSVFVKSVSTDGRISSAGIVSVRIVPPPDWTPPVVARLTPGVDTVLAWKDSAVSVSWSVNDDRRIGVVTLDSFRVDAENGVARRSFVIPVGTTVVHLSASDSSGNVTRDSLRLTRREPPDTVAPRVSRLAPRTDTTRAWKDSVATVWWSVGDDGRLDSVTIDGVVADVDSGRVSRKVVLGLGATVVRLRARDSSGNVTRDSLVLVREALAPADSSLRLLEIGSGKLRPSFRPDSLRYRDTVDCADTAIRIRAVPMDTVTGTVSVEGVVTGGSRWVRLGASGTTTRIRIVARGKDGDSLEYVIDVHRRAYPTFGIPWNEGVEYGVLRDERDGRVYRTVRIGEQNWMAENLAHVVDSSWCPHDSADSCAKYGRLYQWTAAMALSQGYGAALWDGDDTLRQGVCPRGWHVPSRGDWAALVATVEADENVGKGGGGTALKSTAGWDESGSGTDRFGFRALGSGYRTVENGPTGKYGYFWSSAADGEGFAWMRMVFYSYAQLYEGSGDKNAGYSLRCLEDLPDTSTSLKSLSLDAGRLSPAFHRDGVLYVDSVSLRTDSLSISAEAFSRNATVDVDGGGRVSLATDSVVTIVVSNGTRRRVVEIRVFHVPADSTNGVPLRDGVSHGILRDGRDGKEYRTVRIGDRNWMAENLDFARDSSWCPGGGEDSCDKYGRLYRWSGAMGVSSSYDKTYWAPASAGAPVQGTCPDGWHLPDSSEWSSLQSAVASDSRVATGVVGAALKSLAGWNDNGDGSDLFGFRILPAGYLHADAAVSIGQVARFWTSTQVSDLAANNQVFYASMSSSSGARSAKTLGLSVRCVEDPPDTSTALASLVVGSGTLSPTFSPSRASYVDTVSSDARTLSVSVVASSAKATVSIDGGGDLATDSVVKISVSNGGRIRVYEIRVARLDSTWGVPWNGAVSYGVLHDSRDGREYRTVRIGDQNWMAENLDHEGADSSWCYGGSADSCGKYGRLYSWSSALGFASAYSAAKWDGNDSMVRGDCPAGWHLPNASEWGTLVRTVEADPRLGSVGVGAALKSSRGWADGHDGSDLFGFRLLPAGFHYFNASNYGAGTQAESWSSTSDPSTGMVAFQSFADDDGTSLMRVQDGRRKYGRSIRCLEDPADTSTSLRSLVVGQGTLSPAFLPSRLSYVDSVDPEVASLRIEATTASANATASIDGGGQISLGTDSVISVRVSNGGASRVYEIRVFHRSNDSTWGVAWNESVSYGVLHDARDNREYRTVRIGDRNWMAENLGFVHDSSWCYGDSCGKYGRLYTWAGAMDLDPAYGRRAWPGDGEPRRGVCPGGWHLPDDGEWADLAAAISSGSVGTALKSGAGWDGAGSDVYGFRGLPAGYRLDGEFGAIRANAYFWSSSDLDSTVAWTYLLAGSSPDLARLDLGKESAFSVRCVEDLPDTTTRLRSLSVSRGSLSPAFDRDVLSYVDTVESDATTLSVSAVALSGNASVVVDGGGTVSLATKSVIYVQVENGGVRRYYAIRVFRRAPPVDTTLGVAWNESVAYGVVRDARDGQEYRTVAIGSQTWMAENLNRVVDNSWCGRDSCGKYGRYYSWSAAMGLSARQDTSWWLGSTTLRQGACPDGWHVPNATEWNTLASVVRAEADLAHGDAGTALLSADWGEDRYGFRALQAGYRDDTGDYAMFWTASQYDWDAEPAWFRLLSTQGIDEYLIAKNAGLSLRCLKN